MKSDKSVREVLARLCGHRHYGGKAFSPTCDVCNQLFQIAETDLHAIIKEALPEKKDIYNEPVPEGVNIDEEHKVGILMSQKLNKENVGFNRAIDQANKAIDKIFGKGE